MSDRPLTGSGSAKVGTVPAIGLGPFPRFEEDSAANVVNLLTTAFEGLNREI
jgi:hypothetical protein